MADSKKNQDQKPDGSGNPKEESTTSGTGALDDATRNTKGRAEGADEAAPRGQNTASTAGKKKPKRGEKVTSANVHHDGKTYPPGTPIREMDMDKDAAADLEARGHVEKYSPADDADEDDE